LGQNAKYSSRVDVFRFAPEIGHCSAQASSLRRFKGVRPLKSSVWLTPIEADQQLLGLRRSGEIDGGHGVCGSCAPHPIVLVHIGVAASAKVATALYQIVLAVLYPRTEAAKAKWLRWREVVVN
jgi:hypothetical protein